MNKEKSSRAVNIRITVDQEESTPERSREKIQNVGSVEPIKSGAFEYG